MRRLIKNYLFWMFLFALIIRIFKLGIYPHGFHIDEVKVGWNALSIIQTGLDDRGNFLAFYYNTFGDYRPTGIFYFSIPSLLLFGKSEFAIRFTSALFGALTIFPVYLISHHLTRKRNLSIFAAIFISISPWHIATSRATSEIVISTFFALFGIYFFIKLIEKNKNIYAFSSILCFLTSYFLYHSIRILAPVFIVVISIYFYSLIKRIKDKKWIIFTFLTILFSSFLLGGSGEAKERFNQVSILRDLDLKYEMERISSENKTKNVTGYIFDNKAVIYFRKFSDEYLKYFSTGFLTGNSAKPYRYISPGVGLLTYMELVLLLIGIISIFKNKHSPLPLLLLIISPLSAALTIEDSPNLHRAFLMLPFISIIEAYGIVYLFSLNKRFGKILMILVFTNFLFFLHVYFNHSLNHKPYIKDWVLDSSSYRNMGAKDLAFKLNSDKEKYDKIIVTNFPDNLYPWYAFFTNQSPNVFNKNILKGSNEVIYQNIVFSDVKCPSDFAFQKYIDEKILVVDNWECPSEIKIKDGLKAKIIDQISRHDGSLIYTLLERS